jgi:hypothetical protein
MRKEFKKIRKYYSHLRFTGLSVSEALNFTADENKIPLTQVKAITDKLGF